MYRRRLKDKTLLSRARTAVVTGITAAMGLSLLVPLSADAQDVQGEVFTTDFSEHPVGRGVPDGWAEHWASSDYAIAESPSRLVKTSNGDGRHLLAWEDVGVVEGDVEVAMLVRQPDTTRPEFDGTAFQLHLQAGGESGSIDGYLLDYTGTDRQGLRIRRSIDSSQSTRASTNEPFTLQVWHNVVFQRRGDMLRGKIWPYFTEEPAEWTVEVEDTSHSAGLVGVGFFSDRMTQEFGWFSVGTGDEEAERAPDGIEGIEEPALPGVVEPSGAAKYGAVLLDWADVAGADHYEVERDGELIAHGWEITSYADPTIPAGTSGSYRVRGVSVLAGAGEWSAPIEVSAAPVPDELALTFELEPGSPWITDDELQTYLDDLVAASPRVSYDVVGNSGEGRPIYLARFGLDGPPDDAEIAERPTVLIGGGNHGNEQAGREGVMFLMRELATSEDPEVLDWLETYAVLVVPTINPDGTAANTRNLVIPNIDGNRDYINLTSSEAQTVTRVLRDFQPEAVIDAHEWGAGAGHQRGELEMSAVADANASPDITSLSAELAFDRVMATSRDAAGWRSHPYQELYGGPNRLRQNGGLRHAVSYLIESSRHPEVRRLEEADLSRDDPAFRPRRVSAERFALSEALGFLTENVDRVTAVSEASAKAADSNRGPVYTDGSVHTPPTPEQTLDPPPCGWALTEPDGAGVADVLETHGIEWVNRRLPGHGRDMMTFVPAAQRARPVAVAALDAESPYRIEQLADVTTIRVANRGVCRSVERGG